MFYQYAFFQSFSSREKEKDVAQQLLFVFFTFAHIFTGKKVTSWLQLNCKGSWEV
jgi:hypothetical protein